VFESSFASNLAKVWQKHTNFLNKDLVMMLWVRNKPVTCLTGIKVAERQLSKTNIWTTYNCTMLENVAKVLEVICENHKQTIHVFAMGLSYGTCQRILSDKLNMRQIAAKFTPRPLTDHQKHTSSGSQHGT
jgi:hypothetical protein